MNLEENPSNLAQLPAFAGHLCHFGFWGENPFRAPIFEDPESACGNEQYSQHLVDVKR